MQQKDLIQLLQSLLEFSPYFDIMCLSFSLKRAEKDGLGVRYCVYCIILIIFLLVVGEIIRFY